MRRRAAVAVLAAGAVAGGVASVSLASGSDPNLFAVVGINGNLVQGSGVSSVSHVSTGQYEVTFTQDVSGCAYAASTQNAYSQALLISTDGGHASADGVFIETKNQGGGLTDGPFNLIVNCGTHGMQYAVVDGSGVLNRGTAGTTVTNLGTGRYNVTFPASVAHCAYLANLGDPSNGVVYPIGIVATSTSNTANTVYVETKNIGGGLSSGLPFHLNVVCGSAPKTHIVTVAANGYPASSSASTSSFNSATGQYIVATSATVANACATVVSRGQTNTSVPYDPATVETVPGPAPNTFGVQTTIPVPLGGAAKNEAFDAVAAC